MFRDVPLKRRCKYIHFELFRGTGFLFFDLFAGSVDKR
jgi:hypothetical protein